MVVVLPIPFEPITNQTVKGEPGGQKDIAFEGEEEEEVGDSMFMSDDLTTLLRSFGFNVGSIWRTSRTSSITTEVAATPRSQERRRSEREESIFSTSEVESKIDKRPSPTALPLKMDLGWGEDGGRGWFYIACC